MDNDEKNGNEYVKIFKKINDEEEDISNNEKIRNIGIVGEYGSGKSTYISEGIKIINCDKSIEKKVKNIYFSYNIIKSEVDVVNKLHVKILYDLYRILLMEFDPENTLNLRVLSNQTEKLKFDGERKILISGIFLLLIYILFKLKIANTEMIKMILFVMIFIFLSIFIINIYRVIILRKYRIKKIKNIEVDKNNDTDIIQGYLDKIIFIIENNYEEFEVINIIIEDIDRLEKIEVLDELKRLNKLMNSNAEKAKKKYKVVFTYALRRNIFHKNSEKENETRTLSKINKYFDNVIWIKPHISKKPIDIQIIEELNVKKINITPIEITEIKKGTVLFIETCSEIFDDYRVLKNFTDTIAEYKIINSKDVSHEIFVALMLKYNIEYIMDFIKFYNVNVKKDKMYQRKLKEYVLTEEKCLDLIIWIECKIKEKYSTEKSIFNTRDINMLIIFIQQDFNNRYIELIDFNDIIGYDITRIYLESSYENNTYICSFLETRIDSKYILKEEEKGNINIKKCLPNKNLVNYLINSVKYDDIFVENILIEWFKNVTKESVEIIKEFLNIFSNSIKKKEKIIEILLEHNKLIELNQHSELFYKENRYELENYNLNENNILNYLLIKNLAGIEEEKKRRIVINNNKYIYNKKNRLFIYNNNIEYIENLFDYIYAKFKIFEKSKIFNDFKVDEKILLYQFIRKKYKKEQENLCTDIDENIEKLQELLQKENWKEDRHELGDEFILKNLNENILNQYKNIISNYINNRE